MNLFRQKHRRGFSLVELAIALGVIGGVIAGVWIVAGSARQSVRLEQAAENVSLLVEAVRNAYADQSTIIGGASAVGPAVISTGSMPSNLIRDASSTCSSVVGNYLDTPWGGAFDACGTLRLCGWAYGTNTTCSTAPNVPASAPYFAVEFTQLSYGSCLSLTETLPASTPAGIKDEYINGASSLSATGALPAPSTFVAAKCLKASTANVVDFVFPLRAPIP